MLIKKGAEADLYLEKWHGIKAIIKKRMPKKYRIDELDTKIRQTRTVREAQLIHNARTVGIPSPIIYAIDLEKTTIIMKYIEGTRVKDVLNSPTFEKKQELCYQIGQLIGQLHNAGMIHGDLTTSNMIVFKNRIYLLDFGLGDHSIDLEERGVDLLLIKRAFQSAHYKYFKQCFAALTKGYKQEVGEEISSEVMKRLRDIEQRGRYTSRSELHEDYEV